MHYWWNAFALDNTRPTITAKNGARIVPSNDFTKVNVSHQTKISQYHYVYIHLNID